MYSKQHKPARHSADSEVSGTSQFAPRSFQVPSTAEATAQPNQTPDLQAQSLRANQEGNSVIDAAVFTRNVPLPAAPRIQMKLNIGQTGDKHEQEADRVAGEVVSKINPSQSQELTPEPKLQESPKVQMKKTNGELPLQRKLQEYDDGSVKDQDTKNAMTRIQNIAKNEIDANVEAGYTLVDGLITRLDKKEITLDDVEEEVKKFSHGTLPQNFRNQLLNRSLGARHTVIATAGTVIEHYVNDKVYKGGKIKTQVHLNGGIPDYVIPDNKSNLQGLVDATSDNQLPHIVGKGAGLLGLTGYPYVADSYYPQLTLGKPAKVRLGVKDTTRISTLAARAAEKVKQQEARRKSLRSANIKRRRGIED